MKFINHPLAYRETDRAVFQATGLLPLSPSLALLANNVTKARSACAQLRRSAMATRIIPFEADDGKVAIVEVYPALWKSKGTDQEHYASLTHFFSFLDTVSNSDQTDAYLCAFFAGCYEATVQRTLQGILPRVLLPNISPEVLRLEGWIYAPAWPGSADG